MEEGVFFKGVRNFVKKGYFFVPRYEVRGVEIPLQSTKDTWLSRRGTPEVTAAAKQAEIYNIKS